MSAIIDKLDNGTTIFRVCNERCSQPCKGESGYCDERFECGECHVIEVTTDIWFCEVGGLCVNCCGCRDCQPETPTPRPDTQALADLFPAR